MGTTQQISSVLRRAADAGDVPGVVATAANADGVIFEGAFGTRDLATGAPMTTDTVVWIASMTKAVTGACAMQLVEQGKLSLDGDIGKVLPELGRVQVLEGFDADGKPRLRSPKRGITLRHLLTHTSGFAYNIWNADIARYLEATGTPGIIYLPERCIDPAAGVRSGREMGIWDFDRLGRQGGRGGLGPKAWSLHAGQPVGAARYDRHRVQDRRCSAPAAGQDPCPHAGRSGLDGYRNSAGPGIPHGRRWALRDGRRLPEVRADDHARRHA